MPLPVADPFAPGLLHRLRETPRKVALVRPSRIGDFICATPAFRALRLALPQAELTMITLPRLRELVERSPHLDRYVPFPGFPGLAEQFFEARQTVRFFQEMQAEGFDLAIQMQGSGVYSNPFTLLLGARVTAGFIRAGDAAGRLDAALPLPQTGHEAQRILALATFLGVPPQGEATEFPLKPEDHAGAEELLSGADPPFIGLHPAARDATRRWPPERFAQAAREVRRQFGGTIVLLGEAEEQPTAKLIEQQMGQPCLNLVGQTSLPVLGGVMARLAVLLTNDTGPAHVAYALGTPTVTIFGGGEPARYGPLAGEYHLLAYPVPCRPCSYTTCPVGYVCLEQVTVAEVVAAVAETLALNQANKEAAPCC
jgi:lipopolysaccharide heptosyltransferase II